MTVTIFRNTFFSFAACPRMEHTTVVVEHILPSGNQILNSLATNCLSLFFTALIKFIRYGVAYCDLTQTEYGGLVVLICVLYELFSVYPTVRI